MFLQAPTNSAENGRGNHVKKRSSYQLNNGLEYPITEDFEGDWIQCKGNVNEFHRIVCNSKYELIQQCFDKLGLPFTERIREMIMLPPIPPIATHVITQSASSSVTMNRNQELNDLNSYMPQLEHLMPFLELLKDGRVTKQAIECLEHTWNMTILPHIAKIGKGNLTRVEFYDLLFLSLPGYLLKNQQRSELLESTHFGMATNRKKVVTDTMSPLSLSDLLQHSGVKDENASVPASPLGSDSRDKDTTYQVELNALSGSFAGVRSDQYSMGSASESLYARRDLGGSSDEKTKSSQILVNFLGKHIAQDNIEKLMSILFNQNQLHLIYVFQAYQVILKKLVVLVVRYCQANNIILVNGSIASLETEIEGLINTPRKILLAPSTNPDILSFCLTGLNHVEGIGTRAMVLLIQNGKSTGHITVFNNLAELYNIKYDMGPFLPFFKGLIKTSKDISGLASARQLDHSLLPPDLMMVFMMALLEDCIERNKSDPAHFARCEGLLKVLNLTRVKYKENHFKTPDEMVVFMDDELGKFGLYTCIQPEPCDSPAAFLGHQAGDFAQIQTSLREFFSDGKHSDFYQQFLMLKDNSIYIKKFPRDDGSFYLPYFTKENTKGIPDIVLNQLIGLKQYSYKMHGIPSEKPGGSRLTRPVPPQTALPKDSDSKKQPKKQAKRQANNSGNQQNGKKNKNNAAGGGGGANSTKKNAGKVVLLSDFKNLESQFMELKTFLEKGRSGGAADDNAGNASRGGDSSTN